MTAVEIWRDIPEYEGLYQASDLGNIKAVSKVILLRGKYPTIYKERLLCPKIVHSYYRVKLTKDGEAKNFSVHQLIAMTFLGHKPCGMKMIINHKNFNKIDNRPENLEIISQRENANKKHLKSSSDYLGVRWMDKNKNWSATVYINGKSKYLGTFDNEFEAHLAVYYFKTGFNYSITINKDGILNGVDLETFIF